MGGERLVKAEGPGPASVGDRPRSLVPLAEEGVAPQDAAAFLPSRAIVMAVASGRMSASSPAPQRETARQRVTAIS